MYQYNNIRYQKSFPIMATRLVRLWDWLLLNDYRYSQVQNWLFEPYYKIKLILSHAKKVNLRINKSNFSFSRFLLNLVNYFLELVFFRFQILSQEIFFGDKIHLLLRSKTIRRNLVYHEPVLVLIVWTEKVTVFVNVPYIIKRQHNSPKSFQAFSK